MDIGGTKVLVGCLDSGSFQEIGTIPTPTGTPPGKLVERVSNLILAKDSSPRGVGVGIAGLVDRAEGMLISSPNMPDWHDCPVGELFFEALSSPVTVDNDANAFAFGAVDSGEIPPKGTWLLITLGTGIGGAVVMDGVIRYGTGFAGEFGHMTVKVDGPRCACGSTGCWEIFASRRSVVEYYAEGTGEEPDPREIALRAENGDLRAVEAFLRFGEWLGIGLANLGCCLSPHGFLLAGGLAGAYRLFSPSLKRVFDQRCHLPLRIRTLAETRESGAFGAACMARSAFSR